MKTTLTTKKVLYFVFSFLLILWVTPAPAAQSNDIANLDLQSILNNIILSASKHEETIEEMQAGVFNITR